jgi:hypothetical protein
MYQRLTREDKQKIYEGYIQTRNRLENDPTIIAWKTWSKKPREDQLHEVDTWNQYYAKVKESVAYEMFITQRNAMKNGNYRIVREIAGQAKTMRENNQHLTTDAPDFIDPWEFRHHSNIQAYTTALRKIKEMSDYQAPDEIFS